MLKMSKEAKVGMIIISSLLILGWGINFLKGKDIFVPGYKLFGLYGRIDGLTKSSPVYYKGFRIGAVRDIRLSEKSDDIVVTMSIEQDVEFPKNTIAQIYSLDLMGSKGIRFIYGDSDVPLVAEDTMQTSLMGGFADQVSQEVLPLKDKAESLVVKLDSVLANLNAVFNAENKNSIAMGMRNFALSAQNFNKMSYTLAKSMEQGGAIGNTISNIDSFSMLLNNNGKLLSKSMENMNELTGQLVKAHVDSVVFNMNTTLESVNSALVALNKQEGTLGLLLKDERLYDNLNIAVVSLDRLLNDVRHQPKRYVNFSAVSFGGGKSKITKSEELVYKILIKKSKEALVLRGELVKGKYKVYEDRDGKNYVYTIGNEDSFSSISAIYNDVNDIYPKAKIIALKGGKQVDLKSIK